MAANFKSYWQYVWYYPILILGLLVFYSFLYSELEEADVLVIASCGMAVFITAIVFLYAGAQVFPMTLQFGSTRKSSIGALCALEALWSLAMPALLAVCVWALRGGAALSMLAALLPLYLPIQFLAASGGGLLGFAVMRLRKAMRVLSFLIFFVLLIGCFVVFIPLMELRLVSGITDFPIVPFLILVLLAAAGFFGEGLAARKFSV